MAFDNNSVGFELYFKDNLTNPLAQATNKGVASLNRLEGAKGGLTKSSGGLLGSLGGLTGGLGAMLGPAALATAGIAALGAGLRQVISTGMDFTKTMSNVKALLNANSEEFERLNQTAISLGASTVFSSSQVAEAMVNAAMAGQSTNEIIASMPGYLNVAAAANLDLADAVEIGLSTLHQFNLGADKSIDVADQLTYTTTHSATAMQDLAEGLKYIGPAAAALKVPLQEVLAAQGVLANNGLRGSIATRALSTSLQRLANPSKKMSEEMQRLNLSFFDSKGEFIGINNLIGVLEGRLKGFTDEQKASTLSILFGNEAFAEMQILLNKGSEGLKKFTEEIGASQGTSAKIAQTQLDNLSGDVTLFKSAWEGLMIKMFKDGESGFRKLVQIAAAFITRLGNSWEYITKPLKEVGDLFGELWDAIKELLDAVGLLGGEFDLLGLYFKNIKWHLEVMTTPLRITIKFWIWLFNTIKQGVFVVQSFWDALKNLATNISKVFLPVGELLEGVFTLNWSKVKSGYAGLKSGLSSVLGDAGKTFNESLTARMTKSVSGDSQEENTLSPSLSGSKGGDGLLIPNAALNGSTKTNGGIDVVGSEKGSGKSVVVTINNLINTLTVQGTNLQQNIKEAVAEALTDAVRDFEQSYS